MVMEVERRRPIRITNCHPTGQIVSQKFVSLRTNPKSHQERESKTSLTFEVIHLWTWGSRSLIKEHTEQHDKHYTLHKYFYQ